MCCALCVNVVYRNGLKFVQMIKLNKIAESRAAHLFTYFVALPAIIKHLAFCTVFWWKGMACFLLYRFTAFSYAFMTFLFSLLLSLYPSASLPLAHSFSSFVHEKWNTFDASQVSKENLLCFTSMECRR